MALEKVVVLVGGVGGAKLAHGLSQVLSPEQLTVIVNTGDDFWHYGLRICPDLDTVMYTLSGLVNKEFGWGIAGDTENMLAAMRRYGVETWFGLRDQDIATHLLRTQWFRDGLRLTEITQRLYTELGVQCQILPMTDAPVATVVETADKGDLDFQSYFVRYRWQPVVTGLRLEGIESASLSPEAQQAIADADIILLGPSNPWLSIRPILSVQGMEAALLARNVPRVAVTPIVAGKAIKGPASKLMRELGYTPSAETVLRYYGAVINGFVYDQQDDLSAIEGMQLLATDTIMDTEAKRGVLAHKLLDWIKGRAFQ